MKQTVISTKGFGVSGGFDQNIKSQLMYKFSTECGLAVQLSWRIGIKHSDWDLSTWPHIHLLKLCSPGQNANIPTKNIETGKMQMINTSQLNSVLI